MWSFGRFRRAEDRELEDEIRAYVAMAADEKVAAGMSAAEARRQAMADAGGVEQVKQAVRDGRPRAVLATVLQDVVFGARQLRRNPAYAAIAVATLAIGLGATAAMGSLVESVLLRPLPFAQQDRLVGISGWYPKGWVRAVGERSRTLSGVMSFSLPREHNVESTSGPERVFLSTVTANAFEVLGAAPARGRTFLPEEATAGRDHVVLLSDGYWRERFAADPGIAGKSIHIDGDVYSVVGVMPPGLNFPNAETRLWVPVSFKPGDPIDPWAMFNGSMIGRMRPGATPAAVQAELRGLHPELLRLFPWSMPDRWYADVAAAPLLTATVGDVQPRLFLLLAAAALLLLTACCNVASLFVERAAQRGGEFAIRGALGASTARLLRQIVTESLLLGLAAAALAVFLAEVLLPALRMVLPQDLPRLAEVRLHWPVVVVIVAVAVAGSLLLGVLPALRLRTGRLQHAMQTARGSHTADRTRQLLSASLVTVQMAMAVGTICISGVLLHSLWRLLDVDPGFQTDNVLTAQISLDAAKCAGAAGHVRCAQTFAEMRARLAQQPGVQEAALVSMPPVFGNDDGWAFDAEGHPRLGRETPDQGSTRVISPNYFGAMGISLLRGRLFDGRDQSGSSHALVISKKMADQLWPGQDPLGKRVESVGREAHQGVLDQDAVSVVGVVGTTHHGGLGSELSDELYLPLTPDYDQTDMTMVLRTEEHVTNGGEILRRAVASVDRNAPVSRVTSLRSLLSQSAATESSLAILLSTFTLLIAVLGMVGIYGLTTASVSSRAHEMAIRMALGAGRSAMAVMVVRRGLLYAAIGGAAGLVLAVAAVRFLRSMLYATNPLDALTFASVPVILLSITVLASAGPAWKAARIEPIAALRKE